MIIISTVAAWLVPVVGERFAKAAAWAGVVIAAVLLIWAAKAIYDASVIENATNEANSDFLGEKDEATGRADTASDERREVHEERIKTTKELIDEALEKGCSVGEYLASNGARCVRG